MPTDRPIPYLEFKMLKNVFIQIGGTAPMVDSEMRIQPTPHGPATVPFFKLETQIHRIELADETVVLPKQRPGQSEQRYADIKDALYKRAAAASERNDTIRDEVRQYEREGIIKVVSDPYGILVDDEEPNVDSTITPVKVETEKSPETDSVDEPKGPKTKK